MTRLHVLAACAALTLGAVKPALAADAPLTPQDFAYGRPVLTLSGEASAYRLQLPEDVYAKLTRADYGDIRVFNASGEGVPHELRLVSELAGTPAPFASLPLFALRGDAARAIEAVRVKIESGGAAVDLATVAQSASPAPITSYILDGRALKTDIGRLRITWPDTPTAFAGTLLIEASDDLNSWRSIASGSIANLTAGTARLIENELEFPATRARYLRLVWLGASAPFAIESAAVQAATPRISAPRNNTRVQGSAALDDKGKTLPNTWDYDLGARLPIDRVNFALPELNTVARVAFAVRSALEEPWREFGSVPVYRLAAAGGKEQRNAAHDLPLTHFRYLRLRSDDDSNGLGNSIPTLEAGWVSHELRFIARGNAPFKIAYGSAIAPRADTALDELIPGLGKTVTVRDAAPGAIEVLGGDARLQPPPAPFPWKTVLLWGVLVLGVGLLGWMAVRLGRDMQSRG